MRITRTMSAFLCAGYLLMTSAYATVLTFDNAGSSSIPYDYGSRVDASGVDVGGRTNFDLTHGATPNVAVQMFTANYSDWSQLTNLSVWGSNYADLNDVAYHSFGQGARFIFTADSQY